MLSVRRRVSPGRDRDDNPTLSLLTEEVSAAGTRLSNALEAHFRHLSKELQHNDVPVRWYASGRLVERTAEDYLAAMDRLLEALLEAANQPTSASHREPRLMLGL